MYVPKFPKISKMFSAMSLICNGVVWFSTIVILIFETIIVIFKIIILIFETIIVIFKIIIVIFETIIVIFKTIMIVADINIEIEISSTTSQIKILRNSVGRFAMMVMMILIKRSIYCATVLVGLQRPDETASSVWAAPQLHQPDHQCYHHHDCNTTAASALHHHCQVDSVNTLIVDVVFLKEISITLHQQEQQKNSKRPDQTISEYQNKIVQHKIQFVQHSISRSSQASECQQ